MRQRVQYEVNGKSYRIERDQAGKAIRMRNIQRSAVSETPDEAEALKAYLEDKGRFDMVRMAMQEAVGGVVSGPPIIVTTTTGASLDLPTMVVIVEAETNANPCPNCEVSIPFGARTCGSCGYLVP